MLAPRWRKVVGDLRSARGRLATMVLAIAIGILGTTAILSAYTILTREISRNYLGTNPASAQLKLDRVDDALVEAVRNRPGIADAEASSSVLGRVEATPDRWLPLLLFVVKDLQTMRINTVRPETGAWPPPEGTLLLERAALPLISPKLSDGVRVQLPNGPRMEVPISGLVHDPGLAPAWQEQTVYGYVTSATLARWGEDDTLHILKVTVAPQSNNAQDVERKVAELAQWLKQQGREVGEVRIPPPGKHPHQAQMRAILVMLLLFAALSLVLAAVLTATLIGGLLAQQVRQIGIMKTIGARSLQITWIYLVVVAGMGLVAAVLGLPPGVEAGRGLARSIAELLNFALYSVEIPAWVYVVQVFAGVFVPLLAALPPIFGATRTTVREAISDYGTSRNPEAGRLDAWLGKLRGVNRTLLLSLRNPFRRPGRLAFTLLLLASAGGMFLASLNLKLAWERNLADAKADRRYDLEIRLNRPEPDEQVLSTVAGVPGVVSVEPWNTTQAAPLRSDGLEVVRTYPDEGHGAFALRSVPNDSRLVGLQLVEGRWLQPGDTDGVVLNHIARTRFPAAKVGDPIALCVHGRSTTFRLVGVAREIITPAAAYTTPEVFARATGQPGRTNAVRVVLSAHDEKSIDAAARRIDRALDAEGIRVKVGWSEARLDHAQSGHVYLLVFTLIVMAVLMGAVGALGLLSAMATSVTERTREFGVMRAIGGRSATVLRNVVIEGVFVGAMSWCLAVPLSLPLSLGIGRLVGTLAFFWPLPLVLSPGALALWLTLILIGSASASAYPAWRASRLTVRETLAYA
ncbi:MAG: ABC transporter permease [Deltaproteobacteria bacterium]|nr:ABC transporter permease [Deltaproteobacteria bacterium]